MERKLAAILAADAVGYSALMERDEKGTFARLKAHRTELFEPEIKRHHGRVFKLMGDGLLAEFASVVDAVECAVVVQREMAKRNDGVASGERIDIRMGINLGDVIVEGGDIHGDGVNIASRLQGLANPGGVVISGTAYDHVRNKLDAKLEFLGEQRVKNIAEPVRVYAVGGTPAVTKAAAMAATAKPTVAVLPFSNMSGDPEQQYFSDGVTEDIITELSRFHSLFVIARNSSFQYRDKAIDVRHLARELGVRYVVEGSVRKIAARVRITSQLIDAETGNNLWGERFDRNIEELFEVQDEVTHTIVATLIGRLEDAEIRDAVRKRTGSFLAYDALLRGIEHLRGYGDEDNRRARELFESAVSLDPHYGFAHAYLAIALLVEHGYGNAPDSIKQRALASAMTAVRLDPSDGRCHVYLGQAYRCLGELDLALSHFKRGVALNPNDANGIAQLGLVLAIAGRAEEGVKLIRQAMRLNPFHPDWYWNTLTIALYTARRYEEALEASRQGRGRTQCWQLARGAACLAQLGRLDEAHKQATQVLRIKPDFHLSADPSGAEHLFEGMRKAGLPY